MKKIEYSQLFVHISRLPTASRTKEMGQMVGVMSAVTDAKNPGYKLNLRAVKYLADLPSDEYSNVFALRIDSERENVYYHEFASEDYAGTVKSYEDGKPAGTRCMYYVPWADGNYCIFYDIGDDTQTVCVIDLENTERVADICGGNARSLPIEHIIELAQQLFENDEGNSLRSDNAEGNSLRSDNAEGNSLRSDSDDGDSLRSDSDENGEDNDGKDAESGKGKNGGEKESDNMPTGILDDQPAEHDSIN